MCCWVRFQFTHRHDFLSTVGESQLVIVIVTVIISCWVQLQGFFSLKYRAGSCFHGPWLQKRQAFLECVFICLSLFSNANVHRRSFL